MQDWFISWIFVDEENKTSARGWDIRREYASASAVHVASKYIEEVSKKYDAPAERIILMAMNKI